MAAQLVDMENKGPVATEKKGEKASQRMICVEDFKAVADRKLPRMHKSKSAVIHFLLEGPG